MSLLFRQTMDPHSLDVMRSDEQIAMIQWHPERPPRMVIESTTSSFTLTEMREMADELEKRSRR